jgi:hypothetical protein
MPIIPAILKAEAGKIVRKNNELKNMSKTPSQQTRWPCWPMPNIPTTQEAQVGRLWSEAGLKQKE